MAERRQFPVLSALGADRPGIVAEVTEFLEERGANGEDSRMAVLGSAFALMALISGAPAEIARVQSEIAVLKAGSGIPVTFKPAESPSRHRAPGVAPYVVHASAMDHEGIVHAIASALSRCGVNIVSLERSTYPAPISGTPLFRMDLRMDVPHTAPVVRLRAEWERVAEAENADIELRPE